jgi:hypothetical protein
MTSWTALVGFSGTGKTPGINVMKNALSVVVRERGHEIDELRRQHETAVETAKAAHRQWKDKVSEALAIKIVWANWGERSRRTVRAENDAFRSHEAGCYGHD